MTDFGIDVSTFPDLDPAFRPIGGQRAVGEAVARGLLMAPGTLPYAPGDGFDLRAAIAGGVTEADQLRIRAGCVRQALRDERVEEVACRVGLSSNGRVERVQLSITTAEGPFDLVIEPDGLDVKVLLGTA